MASTSAGCSAAGEVAQKKCAGACNGCAVGATSPLPRCGRWYDVPSQEEIRTANELRQNEEEARRKVIDKVRHHSLEMKVSDAEWQWDRGKLTIYFTAEKRVDFRALVRDLAAQFRTRIELRQIGVRDEAARLKGVGRCGREYCCSTWLTELSPVSLALAKDQHLSLNPAQISGGCGRLLCCLKYEHEFYVASRKRFPREGKTLQTARGPEKVVAVDIFRERVFLRHEEQGSRIIPLVQLRDEMEAAHPEAVAIAPPPAPAPSLRLPPGSPRLLRLRPPESREAGHDGAGAGVAAEAVAERAKAPNPLRPSPEWVSSSSRRRSTMRTATPTWATPSKRSAPTASRAITG